MHLRRLFCAAVAAILSVGVPSASFANAAGHQGLLLGHIRTFNSKHQIKQPTPPVQAVSYVNVRDFGAVGNGVTDDTGAIQNAINAAQASGQGVLFPAGNYLHTGVITANGVSLIGVGSASTIVANNPNASAVILTGVAPSIQNLVINTVPAASGFITFLNVNTSSLAVVGAQNFFVQGIAVNQGLGKKGCFLLQSTVGQVSNVTFNSSGDSVLDLGVLIESCTNVSIVNNLFLKEGQAISVGIYSTFVSQAVAIIANTINFTGQGISLGYSNLIDVEQNQIQALTSFGTGISALACNNYSITKNNTWNGGSGLSISDFVPGATGVVSQNVVRNTASAGAALNVAAGTNVQFVSNLFGECGLGAGPVPGVITASSPDPNAIVLLNNVYAGHTNNLANYISASTHINVVSGNVQNQTALPNQLPL